MPFPYKSALGPDSSALDLSVALESVRLRASQTAHSGPIVVGIATVFGLLLAWLGAGWHAIAWSLVVNTGACASWWICSRIRHTDRLSEPKKIAQLERLLWWITVMNTTAVGSGIWALSAANAGFELLYAMTMIQSLYTLGALINASTHPPTFITGAWINMGLLSIYWLTVGENSLATGLTLLGLAFVESRFSNQIYAEFVRSVKIRFENAELLEKFRAQVSVADAARSAAEEANQAKSRFLAAASHDLRQPLHSLLLYTSLLEKGSAENRIEFMHQIHLAAGSLDKLFSSLLDLSKLDSGAISTNIAAVDLAPLLKDLAGNYQVIASEKDLALEIPEKSIRVETDAFLLERILRNLVDNAIKYTKLGSVRIEVNPIGEQLEVAVIDSGIGIPSTDLNTIFDEFHRVEQATASKISGSGLGLAIVSRLCQLLGHRLHVDSTLGKGSTFTITLNLATSHSTPFQSIDESATEQPPDLSKLQGKLVVIVDDDEAICRAMSAVVTANGALPQTFLSVEAVEKQFERLDANRPFAVISDYRFEGRKTGVDVITTIRAKFPGVPAVIVSGDIHRQTVAIASLKNVEVFRKPIGDRAIRDWLINTAALADH